MKWLLLILLIGCNSHSDTKKNVRYIVEAAGLTVICKNSIGAGSANGVLFLSDCYSWHNPEIKVKAVMNATNVTVVESI